MLLLLFSIAANYAFGLLIEKKKKAAYPHLFLVLGLIFNLGLIGFFKYGNFIAANINFFLIRPGISSINLEQIHLPLGISFFTFQAMSYSLKKIIPDRLHMILMKIKKHDIF